MLNGDNDKILVIMRGISGSGKSTLARVMRDSYESDKISCQISSADNFFINEEGYNWDGKFIKYAHQMCKAKVAQGMMKEINIIFVDNTHTKTWEYEDYVKMARNFGYGVSVINMMQSRNLDLSDKEYVDLCHERNKHKVPRNSIQSQFDRFEDTQDELIEIDISDNLMKLVAKYNN